MQTQFGRWLEAMEWTQQKAADVLGLSVPRVGDFVRGLKRGTADKLAAPDIATRVFMAALLAAKQNGTVIDAWPHRIGATECEKILVE